MTTVNLPEDSLKKESSFTAGFFNTFRSIPLAWKNKGLVVYFIIPFFLNIALLSAVFYFSYTSLVPLTQSVLTGDIWYIRFIRALISPVLFVILSIFSVIVYSFTGAVISAPFLEILSVKTEKILGIGGRDEKFSVTESLSGIMRALSNSLRLIILIIVINLLTFLLNIFPGGSFIYASLNFVSALFFYGFQFYDFPLEREKYSFKEKIRIAWSFKTAVLGCGFSFFVISFIPLIGFLGLNMCTIGAALTYTKGIRPVLDARQSGR